MADTRPSAEREREREREPLLRPSNSSSSILSSAPKSTHNPSHAESIENSNEEPPAISKSRGSCIIASIGLLIFLQATNISILTTTQSSIAADLDAFERATWLTSSYLIAMSSLTPLMGRLSQVFSPRICLFTCTVVVSAGSIITSTSISFTMFTVGRVVTGVGTAGILVIAAIIAIQMTSAKNRGLFLGILNAGMTVGVSLGAVIAGALEPGIGWKPLFGIQAPLALLAGFVLLMAIPTNYVPKKNEYTALSLRQKLARIDYPGCVLLIVTVTLFLLALSGPHILIAPLVLSLFSLPLFILYEVRVAEDPIIPVTVLKSRGTLLTCLATVGFMMTRWLVLFYTPVYAIAVRMWTPAVAGSILIPTNAGFAIGGILAGYFHIHRNGSFYLHSMISMAVFPLTLLVLAFISDAHSSSVFYVVVVFVNGLLTGASLNYTLVHVLHLTPSDVHPVVLSLLATFRGFAGSFGSAIGGGLFARVLRKSLVEGFKEAGLRRDELIRQLLGSPALVGRLKSQERAVAVRAYEDGLKILFLSGVGLSAAVVFVQAGTGWTGVAKDAEESEVGDEVEGEESLVAGS